MPKHRITRHQPPRPYSRSAGDTEVHVKAVTPYVSLVRRVVRMATQLATKQPKALAVVVRGMGNKSIDKCVQLAAELGAEGYKVGVYTRSVEVVDEREVEGEAPEVELVKRVVAAVEVRVSPRRQVV